MFKNKSKKDKKGKKGNNPKLVNPQQPQVQAPREDTAPSFDQDGIVIDVYVADAAAENMPDDANLLIDDEDGDKKDEAKKDKTKKDKTNKPKLSLAERIANIFAPYAANKLELEEVKKNKAQKESDFNELEDKYEEISTQIQELEVKLQAKVDEVSCWESSTLYLPDPDKLAASEIVCGRCIVRAEDLSIYADTLKDKLQVLLDKIKDLSDENKRLKEHLENYEEALKNIKSGNSALPETPSAGTTSVSDLLEIMDARERLRILNPYFIDILKGCGVQIVEQSVPASIQKLKNSIPNLSNYILRSDYDSLQKEYKDLKANYNKRVDPSAPDEIRPVVIRTITKDLNDIINEPGKEISSDTDYEKFVSVVADCLLKPDNIDDAIVEGRNQALSELSRVIGRPVDDVDEVESAVNKWHCGKLRTEILPLFKLYRDGMEIDELAKLSNAASGIKKKVDLLLQKYNVTGVEELPAAIREYELNRILKDMRENESSQYQLTGEMRNTIARSATIHSAITQLVKLAKEKAASAQAAQNELETAVAERAAIVDGVIEAVNQSLALQSDKFNDTDPIEAVKYAGQTLNDIIDAKQKTIEDAELQIEECNSVIAANNAIVAQKDALLDNVYGHALGLLEGLIGDVEKSINGIVVSGNREKPVAKAVDERIIKNDFYGFAEFKEQLDKNLSQIGDRDFNNVIATIKDTFVECLKIPSASWIDNLARLYLYSQVPFIAQQFMATKVNIDKIAVAFGLLESMLDELGINLIYPALFVDVFDPGIHESETIKNITGMVTDIASHVDNDETIVDLYTVGFSVDGVKKENPVVSRLNK